MTYCFGDINVWSRKVLIYFCWFRIFFGVLIANILWAVVDTPISHTTFWKSVEIFKELFIAIWKWLQKNYSQLVTIILILNLQVFPLTAHRTVECAKLKKELLLLQLRRLEKKQILWEKQPNMETVEKKPKA